jgi:hypothetical protein
LIKVKSILKKAAVLLQLLDCYDYLERGAATDAAVEVGEELETDTDTGTAIDGEDTETVLDGDDEFEAGDDDIEVDEELEEAIEVGEPEADEELEGGAVEGGASEPLPPPRELSLLLKCFNLIYGEVACDYVALKAVETITSADGRIKYNALSKPVIDVLYAKDDSGAKIDFKLNPTYIQGARGQNEIAYTYMPEELGIDDEVAYETQKVSALTFAYGTASEYCLIRNQFDEAQTWEKRYKDALLIAQRLKKEVIVPKRGWY